MFKAAISFTLLFCSVVSAISADYAQARQCSGQNQQLVFRGNCRGNEDCSPGRLPPSFQTPPAVGVIPPSIMPVSPVAGDEDTKMGLAAILGLLVTGCAVVGGVLRQKHIEDETDEHEAELTVAKEKAFRERAIKMAASKHVAND